MAFVLPSLPSVTVRLFCHARRAKNNNDKTIDSSRRRGHTHIKFLLKRIANSTASPPVSLAFATAQKTEREAAFAVVIINIMGDVDQQQQKKQVDDLLTLFSTTLHSLAADAAAVREISSLAELFGVVSGAASASSGAAAGGGTTWSSKLRDGGHDKENASSSNSHGDKQYYVHQLGSLDRTIANMEQKVIALREIIHEENRALTQFETSLHEETEAQASLLKDMMAWMTLNDDSDSGCNPTIGDDHNEVDSVTNRRRMLPSRSNSDPLMQQEQHNHRPLSSARRSFDDSFESLAASVRRRRDLPEGRRSREDSLHINNSNQAGAHCDDDDDGNGENDHPPPPPHEQLVLARISKSEIEEHSRNVPFGLRISRLDCNEALVEIEKVVRERTAAMNGLLESSSSTLNNGHSHPHLSSNALHRRFEYLRQRQGGGRRSQSRNGNNPHNNNLQDAFHAESPLHAGQYWVTEQELRTNCAFFRHGESTARGILSLLCSLKRLKQLPGKNMEITYICCVPQTTDNPQGR